MESKRVDLGVNAVPARGEDLSWIEKRFRLNGTHWQEREREQKKNILGHRVGVQPRITIKAEKRKERGGGAVRYRVTKVLVRHEQSAAGAKPDKDG